jgi:hypothetical protein
MGRAFGTLGERKSISGGKLQERGHLKGRGTNGQTVLKMNLK